MEIKYLLYDTENNINTQNFNIKTFKFNKNTLLNNFKKELLKNYNEDMRCMINFKIITSSETYYINDEIIDYKIKDVIPLTNIIYLVIPCLPIGGDVARYNGYRILIHSNEEKHKNLPHVHIINGAEETRIDLLNIKILDNNIFTKKAWKKISKYLIDNQEYLIKIYNDILNKKVTQFNIEILR